MPRWRRASRQESFATWLRSFPTPGWRATRPSRNQSWRAMRTFNTSRVACSRRAHFSRRQSVHAQCSYDYAVIRVVPRVERQEFLNAGVILWCQEQGLLEARVELDEARMRALDSAVDVEAVRRHLASFSII